jgi:pimeloyl-ACP methyl ester carboxylesterase
MMPFRGEAGRAAAVGIVMLAGVSGCGRKEPAPMAEAPAAQVATVTAPAAPAQEARAAMTAKAPDAFYDPPADAKKERGALLRSEQLAGVTLPAGMQGWRILYATSVNDATPATAVATVFAPVTPPPGPRPVILWTHGTTGLMQKCMPSLVSAPTEGIPAREKIAEAGWVVVATDYSFAEKDGPHPYIIGEGEARSTLDAMRAAKQMPELMLDKRAVVWGHSQGGHAALWTGIVAPRYAPELEIAGVAAIAPAADIKNILELNVPVDRRLGPYLAASYSAFYPDVKFEEALRPEALDAGRQMIELCGFVPPEDAQRTSELTATFDGPALATETNAALEKRLEQNAAMKAIAAPVLIAQGLADTVVLPEATNTYVDKRCAANQRLEYWTFTGLDHGTIVQPGTPLDAPLVGWTTARFAGEPQIQGCARKGM